MIGIYVSRHLQAGVVISTVSRLGYGLIVNAADGRMRLPSSAVVFAGAIQGFLG